MTCTIAIDCYCDHAATATVTATWCAAMFGDQSRNLQDRKSASSMKNIMIPESFSILVG